MDNELSDYDVLKIDLPAYEEDGSAIPDIEPESSFAENKEKIYRRNRLIAADMQLELISKQKDEMAEKRSGSAGALKGRTAAAAGQHSIRLSSLILAAAFMAVIAILIFIVIQIKIIRKLDSAFTGEFKPYGYTEAETTAAAKETTPTYIDPAVIEQYINGTNK